MIKIGCSGFPVGRKTYTAKFKLVELSALFERAPKDTTVQNWRDDTPKDFEFVVCASKVITHPSKTTTRHGYFQDTPQTQHAYSQSLKQAKTLDARLILFAMPAHLTPHPDLVGRLQKFFRKNIQDGVLCLWETPASWPVTLVEQISQSLRIAPVMNPLKTEKLSSKAPLRYFRLGDSQRTRGVHRFSENELKRVRALCDKPMNYVIFNNGPYAFEDAQRFASL